MAFIFRKLFFCCFKSFLKGGAEESEEFYNLLGLSKDADANDVRRAYKKKSLEYHPDKLAQRGKTLTPEDQAKFQRIKEAHDVLVDPEKRRLYDELGEKGMKFLDDPMSNPEYPMHTFMKSKKTDRIGLFLILLGIVMIPALIPILMNLEIDGTISSPWTALLTPLWIVNTLYLCLLIAGIVFRLNPELPEGLTPEMPEYQMFMKQFALRPAIFSLVRFCILFAFEIVICLRLDDTISADYSLLFIMLYVYEGCTLAELAPVAFGKVDPNAYNETQGDEEDQMHFSSYEERLAERSEARRGLLTLALRVWVYLFLGLRCDGDVTWSWWLVALPFWCMLALACVAGVYYRAQAGAIKATLSKPDFEDPAELAPEDQPKAAAMTMLQAQSAQNLCSCCCCLIMGCLAVAKLQGASFSSAIIFLPFYVVLGCVLFVLCCAVFCVEEPGEEEGEGGAGGAGGLYRPPDEAAVQGGGGGESKAGDQQEAGGRPVPPTVVVPAQGEGARPDGGGGGGGGATPLPATTEVVEPPPASSSEGGLAPAPDPAPAPAPAPEGPPPAAAAVGGIDLDID